MCLSALCNSYVLSPPSLQRIRQCQVAFRLNRATHPSCIQSSLVRSRSALRKSTKPAIVTGRRRDGQSVRGFNLCTISHVTGTSTSSSPPSPQSGLLVYPFHYLIGFESFISETACEVREQKKDLSYVRCGHSLLLESALPAQGVVSSMYIPPFPPPLPFLFTLDSCKPSAAGPQWKKPGGAFLYQ